MPGEKDLIADLNNPCSSFYHLYAGFLKRGIFVLDAIS